MRGIRNVGTVTGNIECRENEYEHCVSENNDEKHRECWNNNQEHRVSGKNVEAMTKIIGLFIWVQ